VAVVQLEVIELIRDGPDAAHRIGELPVQLARRWFCSRRLGHGTQTKILTCLKRQAEPSPLKRLASHVAVCSDVLRFRRTNTRTD
jgi:hypothetical protein